MVFGKPLAEQNNIPALIGHSIAISRIRGIIKDVANTNMNIMIRGESGTGKDVVARFIHAISDRKWGKSFVKINCPSIPETLLESELFGHEAGAFTGAQKRKPGRLELAADGTVFLDEIGEIPTTVQAKLLQFIESKKFTRVGGVDTITINTRIISATNAPLEKMIEEKTFREDLYYRLNEYSIYIPALRERTEDIPHLVNHFIYTFSKEFEKEPLQLSSAMMATLMKYNWPGNVRELQSIIKRFVFTGKEETIEHSLQMTAQTKKAETITEELEDAEKKAIITALIENHWNRRNASKKLGMSYSSLRRRITKYNLHKPSEFMKHLAHHG
jgi:two-component system response regulator AtoC